MVVYNTAKMDNGPNTSAAFHCGYENDHIISRNNIFANIGTGRAILLRNSNLDSDYNLLFSNGAYIVEVNTGVAEYIPSFFEWQAFSGDDMHSINIEPEFVSVEDLHTFHNELDGLATPLFAFADDIDNEQRHPLFPDIDADEFAIIPEIIISEDTIIGCGAPVQLNATVNFNNPVFQWTPSSGLSNPSIGNPIANPDVTTTYIVNVSNNLYSISGDVTVYIQNISDFSYQVSDYTVNLNMEDNLCASSEYLWSFGNGMTIDQIQNPIFTYSSPGIYTICLQCGSGIGCSSCAQINIICDPSKKIFVSPKNYQRQDIENIILWENMKYQIRNIFLLL